MTAAKPAGLIVTFKLAGSVPVTWVVTPFTSSQLPVLVACAVNVSAAAADTCSTCGGGMVPPTV